MRILRAVFPFLILFLMMLSSCETTQTSSDFPSFPAQEQQEEILPEQDLPDTTQDEQSTNSDEDDTVTVPTEPSTIEIEEDSSSIAEPEIGVPVPAVPDTSDDIVYITRTGEKYHRGTCRYLSQSKIPITRENAIKNGYTPCKVCKP